MSQQSTFNQTSETPLSLTLFQMISGLWVSRAIYVAAKLGIADLLKDGAKSSQELASSTNVAAQSLYRVLRALASIGIFAEVKNQYFELTPLAEYLQTSVPSSMRAIALMYGGEEWLWQPWGNILYSVKSGFPAFDDVFGMPLYLYLAQNPEAAAVFDQAMSSFTAMSNAAIIDAYDFSSFDTLVDVGGGNGSFLAAILEANPSVKGIVYDRPPVIASAKQYLEAAKANSRCEVVGGDFFESVPSGGNAYVIKNVIHNWDDERAQDILKNCHGAMSENSRLLVIESLLAPGNEPDFGKFVDLQMLVMTSGGRERTEAEFRDLFDAAGFRLTNITPTQCPLSVVEGVRMES